jgi:hypothetical protein
LKSHIEDYESFCGKSEFRIETGVSLREFEKPKIPSDKNLEVKNYRTGGKYVAIHEF